MSRTWSRAAVYAAICSLAIGCGTDTRLPPSELTRYGALRPDAGASVDSCEVKGGCACEPEGARVECGSVKEKVAGYTWCAVGEQVCSDGKWSPCVTDRVVLRKQTLTLSGLGESTSCAEENPCSPGCNAFEDDGRGLVLEADAGLVESEGGLTLTPNRDLQGNGACESLEIVPDTAQIVLNELQLSAPSTVSLSLRALPEGCVDGSVSALWSVDRSDVASVVGDELSGDTAGSVGASAELNLHRPIAGPIEVSAFLGRLSASATVTVSVQVADTAAAPTGALGAFSESADDDAVDPTELLYPYADTVFPLGQPAPKLQWTSLAAVEASLWGSCALRNDGSVRCWGTNSYGALQERPGPYVALSSRYQHVCGLSPEGAIDCWGSNSHFQATDQPPTYVDVAAGNVHTCGLRADGTVECWGDNDYGQSEWQAGPYTQISAGAYHTCGLRTNGDADCWGNDIAGQGGVYTGPFTSVQAGRNHACALRADRTLQCWGGGEYGENEVPAGNTPYEAISVGSEHNCALATDGTAHCWGRNDYGQGESRPGPFVSVSAGGYHTCGLLETGAVECWGLESGGRTLGLPPAAVRIGLRYPESGSPLFEWSAIVPEYQGDFVDAPRNTRPMVAKPRYVIPNDVWRALEGAASGQAFLLSLQRFTGERLLAPVERRLHFSDAPLSGQIVYQSYGTRAVHNATGTYEDTSERWGAVQFAHDTRNGHSSLAAGFDSADSEAGANAGCRGCHSVSTFTGTLMTGFDGHRDAEVRLLTDLSAQPGELFSPRPREHGGFLWAAQHPFEPYAFTSRGPSPCATLAETGMGSCDSANFSSLSGDLIGASALVAAAPGGMVGAAWLDSDSDGVYESASENQLVALTSGALGVPMQTSGLPDDLRAAIPVFSPEGERLAFTHYAGSFTDGAGAAHSGDKRSLAMADYDVETQAFSNFQRITNVAEAPCDERYSADPCLDVWPSFVPSGAGIVYQREVFNNARVTNSVHADFGGTRSGCEQRGTRACDDGSKAALWWVVLNSDGEPSGEVALARANGEARAAAQPLGAVQQLAGVGREPSLEPLLNYQPSVAPVRHGRHHWVVFTSRRAYGNVATANPWWSDPRVHALGHTVTPKKLWVAALDTEATIDDPSAPAFYLEGQETQGANGRPVWVEQTCVEPSETRSSHSECLTDADCCGAGEDSRCSLQLPLTEPPVHHCMPFSSSTCIERDAELECVADSDCCGADAGVRCASGRCRQPPALVSYEPAIFERNFEAECPHGTLPIWQFLEWQARLPEGTSIEFSATTGATLEELDENSAVELGTAQPPDTTTWTTWGRDISDSIHYQLDEAGYRSQQWLRVSMQLNPDSGATRAPLLTNWRVIYDCADSF